VRDKSWIRHHRESAFMRFQAPWDAMARRRHQVLGSHGEPKHVCAASGAQSTGRHRFRGRPAPSSCAALRRPGDDFAPQTPGLGFLPQYSDPTPLSFRKTTSTMLSQERTCRARLTAIAPERVLIAGWATRFLALTTVRSSVTTIICRWWLPTAIRLSDRPHLDASASSAITLDLNISSPNDRSGLPGATDCCLI